MAGAASASVCSTVSGPSRPATVLHAGHDAVYLDLDGACLGVVSSRGVHVPCGVRTRRPRLPLLRPGDGATVGEGSIRLPGLEVEVTEIVDTTVGVLGPDAVGRAAHLLREAVGDRLAGALAELPEEPMRRLAECDASAVAGLLGFGSGLTPLGDDVLAGWLAVGAATRHPALASIRTAVGLSARQRTTTLSATLLACAARGEGVPQFRRLLEGLAVGDADLVEQSADDVLDIGDTSGSGLVLGALTALDTLDALTALEALDVPDVLDALEPPPPPPSPSRQGASR
ncbi:hypothetical protein GCM10023168_05020 [Fodinibacter luteus]|uniref:DUF2877 domain-containing protein n=1 Tax=Fodinibacter luteus TaxID=552064 RepID=A0ABP8K147_9MICO